MVEQRERSLILLARIQAAVGGLVAVAVFGLYALRPAELGDATTTLTTAILGMAGLVYFLTIHQVLGRTKLALSTLILTLVTATNFVLVIASTGGLDSPYYSLWLLAIVVAGIFGTTETIVVLALTIVYYVFAMFQEGLKAPFIRDHIVQLAITLVAAGLAEWVHYRSRRANATSTKLASLSGQLTAEQLKAQALMGSIGEGVMVVDTARKIQLFNKAAQQLTGWDESSAQNIDYNLVMPLRTADDHELTNGHDPFAQVWASHAAIVRDDLVMTTRAGRKIQLNLSISPITDDQGQPTGAIALFRDISHEKEVERQKDEFVSTASHEMRTPVAAIEGYIALAMNPNVATIDDRAKKYLEKSHETIKHLGELFRDLLSAAKAEEGNLNAKIEPVNVGELLQGTVGDMQFAAQKKGLTLVLQTSNMGGKSIAPIYYVAASPERLREVIMNLIDNAIKYTMQGGVKVTMTGDTKEVKIAVSDTGVGIAAEDIPHLFQKFYRVDNSATRTIGGTGLGLYLCRRMIEIFNGRIWVESRPDQGSTFNVTLPRLSDDEVKRLQLAATEKPATTLTAPGGVVQPGAGAATPPRPITMPVPLVHAATETMAHRSRIS
ncbi:MAG TPA: ATP-binding protein [Candidatus Saccharimonadia bacterium]|nr:ATP-binding protein [Candidatus Saccharimonadia bacterium]